MRIITNKKFIKRNQAIGKYLTIGSIIVLLAGMATTFMPNYWSWSLIAVLVGFTGSQFAIHYTNQYGRSPRPDELVTNALKGLNDQYSLYHYITPVSHLLIGPSGIWTILPYRQKGTITYDERRNRWNQKGGNLYLKLMAQEGLGRPDLDVRASLADADQYLNNLVEDESLPPAQAALVFMHPQVKLDSKNAPVPTILPDKLKDLVRRAAREHPLPMDTVHKLQEALPGSTVE